MFTKPEVEQHTHHLALVRLKNVVQAVLPF